MGTETGVDKTAFVERKRGCRVFAAAWPYGMLVGALLLCYGNTFNASWQYDDFGNIVYNPNIFMTEISAQSLEKALIPIHKHQVLSRPLAYLSFAGNYYLGGLDVFGYHVVNFVIHCVAAGLLFLFIHRFLRLPVHRSRYDSGATLIAWTAVFLWACHPIQVTAVTFIVQRMASMAGMFYVAALYCYVIGRTRQSRRWPAYVACFLCGLGALLSKENTVVLPFTLVLLELCFFQPGQGRASAKPVLLIAVAVIVLATAMLLFADIPSLFTPIEGRPFSRAERLLTQPRVLFHYVSLLLMPMAARLSIVHDVAVSRGLLTPWTTLPALAGLVMVACFFLMTIRRYPLASFCGLFYLLNHSVESSFLNLELFYEHRNYIPSMLFFVVPAIGFWKGMALFRSQKMFKRAIVGTAAVVLLSLMHTTYLYNDLFRTEGSLWSHVVYHYPNMSIGHNYLSQAYWNMGEYEKAAEESRQAIELGRYNADHQKALGYYNLSLYEAYYRRDYDAAEHLIRDAMELYDDYYLFWRGLSKILVLKKDYKGAEDLLLQALKRYGKNEALEYLLGIVYLKQGKCSLAELYAKRCVNEERSNARMLLAQSHACAGSYNDAIVIFEKMASSENDKNNYKKTMALMAIIECAVKLNRVELETMAVKRLLKLLGSNENLKVLEFSSGGTVILPYTPDTALINDSIRKYTQK